MGKYVEPEEKISQRPIGFPFRQIRFFNDHRDMFKPDKFCRNAIDEQIRNWLYTHPEETKKRYLKEDEKTD